MNLFYPRVTLFTYHIPLTRAKSDKYKAMDALCAAIFQLQEVLPADCELANPEHR